MEEGRTLLTCLGREDPVTVPRGQERRFFLNGNNSRSCNRDAEGWLAAALPQTTDAGAYLFAAFVYF